MSEAIETENRTNGFKPTEIRTFPSNLHFDFADPRPEAIVLRDVAWCGALEGRYANHIKSPAPVALHEVMTVMIADVLAGGMADPHVRWACVHHDNAETYTRDMPSPAKTAMGEAWQKFARPIERACNAAFGVGVDYAGAPIEGWAGWAYVKQADHLAYYVESEVLRGLGRQDKIPDTLRHSPAFAPMARLLERASNTTGVRQLWCGLVAEIAGDVSREALLGGPYGIKDWVEAYHRSPLEWLR